MEHPSLPSASATVTCDKETEASVAVMPDVLLETESSLSSLVASNALAATDNPDKIGKTTKSTWKQHPEIQVFLSTFLTIFLAELGDKTQVTTLLMAAESHQPWIVFAGAGTALVATSLIGVWLGCWLAKRVSAKTLEKAAGVLLLLIATQLCWEVMHL